MFVSCCFVYFFPPFFYLFLPSSFFPPLLLFLLASFLLSFCLPSFPSFHYAFTLRLYKNQLCLPTWNDEKKPNRKLITLARPSRDFSCHPHYLLSISSEGVECQTKYMIEWVSDWGLEAATWFSVQVRAWQQQHTQKPFNTSSFTATPGKANSIFAKVRFF